MAGGLPPPPTRAANGDFAWTAWYNQLYTLLSTSGSVSWSLIDKAGSSIADLASKAHDLLTGLQGGTTGEHYHLTAAEYSALTGAGAHNSLSGKQGGAVNEYYHLSAAEYTKATAAKSYGAFHDNTTQTAAVINTAYPIVFDSTDISSGVALGTPTSRVVCSTTNVYNFQFSAQLRKASASAAKVWIWCRVNGVDLTDTAGEVTLAGSNAALIAAWNYVLPMTAGDYFELVWATDSTACQIIALTAAAPVPGIPSIILTVTDNIS